MKKALFIKKTLVALLAAAMTVTAFAGCGSSSGSSSSSGSGFSKAFDASFSYAESKVSDYSSAQQRMSGIFSDKVFSTANAAALMLNDKSTDEDYEKVARYLYLDTITVADENGKIVASYPKGDEGKSIRDMEDKKMFNRVVKGITVKLMSDPVSAEEAGVYTFIVGVPRSSGTGAVIVSFDTDDYAEVTGEQLAESCGANAVILSNGKIISATLSGAEAGKELDSLGVKAEDLEKDSFEMTVGDAKYNCKSKVIDKFTLILAEPK